MAVTRPACMRSALVVASLMAACIPQAVSACTESGIAQLSISGEPASRSVASLLSTEGFPALSEHGDYLAVFHVDGMAGGSVVLYTLGFLGRIEGPWTLDRWVLIDPHGTPLDDEGFRTLERNVALANAHLCERRFRPMEELYDLRHTFHPGFPRPSTWELERFGWQVSYEYATDTVLVTKKHNDEKPLKVVRPTVVSGPVGGHPFDFCSVRGAPIQAWVDKRTRLVVFRIRNSGGPDYCDRPDQWLVERLP